MGTVMSKDDDQPVIVDPIPGSPINCSLGVTLRWSKNKTDVKKWWLCVADDDGYKAGKWNKRNLDKGPDEKEEIFGGELAGARKLYVQVIGTVRSKTKDGKAVYMDEEVMSEVAEYPCILGKSA